MDRKQMIKEFLELEQRNFELTQIVSEKRRDLICLVTGKNKCIHFTKINVGYHSYESHPACATGAKGHKYTNDMYNRIDFKDCAVCGEYKKNLGVKPSP
tara:strand:- start:18 stop:314 length:297 start_codon:yes stop_codon:yes gene_type:complete